MIVACVQFEIPANFVQFDDNFLEIGFLNCESMESGGRPSAARIYLSKVSNRSGGEKKPEDPSAEQTCNYPLADESAEDSVLPAAIHYFYCCLRMPMPKILKLIDVRERASVRVLVINNSDTISPKFKYLFILFRRVPPLHRSSDTRKANNREREIVWRLPRSAKRIFSSSSRHAERSRSRTSFAVSATKALGAHRHSRSVPFTAVRALSLRSSPKHIRNYTCAFAYLQIMIIYIN